MHNDPGQHCYLAHCHTQDFVTGDHIYPSLKAICETRLEIMSYQGQCLYITTHSGLHIYVEHTKGFLVPV